MKKSFVVAMAVMMCSTAAIQPISLPACAASVQAEAETPEKEWISTGTDAKNTVIYDSVKNDSFKMSGRTFRQGILFKGLPSYYSTETVASIQYDVSAVKSLHFMIGHLDNAKLSNGTLIIMKDETETDSIPLSYNMTVKEYTLDVSDAKTVAFTIKATGGADYGIGDVSVDGSKPSAPSAAPKYESPEKMLDAGYNRQYASIYTAEDKSKSFKMNGRTYYQGVMFTDSGSYNINYVSIFTINTENIKKLRFTAGHVDNTVRKNATLQFYRDNVHEESEDIALTPGMPLKDIELDVTDTQCLMIRTECPGEAAYALANFAADDKEAAIPCDIPAAGTPEQLLNSMFNSFNCSYYTKDDKSTSFKMNGRTYYQGMMFSGGASYNQTNESLVSLNVENYKTLKFTAGHIDNTTRKDATVTVYRDNVKDEAATMSLNSTMKLKDYTLDVADTKVLRFYVERGADSAYAFADFSADEKECAVKHTVPSYASAEKLLDAGFNHDLSSVCSATDKSKSFKMNGRTYYQGIICSGGASYNTTNTSRITFNTEKISKLSFTAGHIDNTALKDATVYIYRDNVKSEDETISLSAAMPLKKYELDVKDTDVLIFVVVRNSDAAYGFSNVAFDDKQAELDCHIPKYEEPVQMLKEGFNPVSTVIYTGEDTSKTFSVGDKASGQGIVFQGGASYSQATENRISFNVENVGAVTAKLGFVKGTGTGESVLRVMLDNKEIKKITLTKDMTVSDYVFNTVNGSVLELVVTANRDDSYALADIAFAEPQTEVMTGDVNGDGEISVEDAQLALVAYVQSMAGLDSGLTEEQSQAADVNEDKTVSVEDAQMILIYYVSNTVSGIPTTWDALLGKDKS